MYVCLCLPPEHHGLCLVCYLPHLALALSRANSRLEPCVGEVLEMHSGFSSLLQDGCPKEEVVMSS